MAFWLEHYDDVIMTMLASQITSLTVVYSIVYSGVNQRKHQSSASLAFVREIHRGPVNFRTNGQLRGKCFHLMTSSWTVVIVPCGGMCKVTTQGVNQSRASQWRSAANRRLDTSSIIVRCDDALTCSVYFQNLISCILMVIGNSI